MESLALKYRPKSFAEVVGQPVITSVLSRQIETKTFRNAYLFAGPSGCGKTTLARIMASEINNGEGTPIEIDAASNNGVDNIRELIISAQQTALDAEYNIYIIDECHMLSNAAWNAALKLIEEPPAHSIFIFCTTNPDKIPETILTRVQRFDFVRIPSNLIKNRLEFICNEEPGLVSKYDSIALERIAQLADGFMREAITLFDKCTSYSDEITLENVEKVLGLTKIELLVELTNALTDKNLTEAQNVVNKIKSQNSNLLNVLDSILEFLINCAKYKKFNDISYTIIPKEFQNKLKLDNDIMFMVDRAFRHRCLSQTLDTNTLLDMLLLEICNR